MLKKQNNPAILSTPYYFSATWDGHFDVSDVPDAPPLPDELIDAAPAKQASYRAGRYCAAKAIQALNRSWPVWVGRDRDGSPRWPSGVVGSITHTDDFVSAAVAPVSQLLGIGLDSEKIMDEKILDETQRVALLVRERDFVLRLPFSAAQIVTLLFSAKESVYKCVHPLVKHPFDFTDIDIVQVDVDQRSFEFRLPSSWDCVLPSRDRYHARFEFDAQRVHTAVEISPASTHPPARG